ncbi:hypothetical protein UFOVP1333_51 [uncultured Caudovirales phage]|uniref:Uncharacterized protein n=1 Tax=uncultured Caudovirales phage TaxID=2100421 RepID=A0A6J5S2A7_9CAUD|nr:hypothetical protein UFOVP1333_51 [uncultured Caudovirales phage]
MFWLWVVVIIEGLIILGLINWLTVIDRAAHQRLLYLEEQVESLLSDMRNKADKYIHD